MNFRPQPVGQNSDPFRSAAENGDSHALIGALAPRVVLHSPVTFHPYVGKQVVGRLLQLVSEAFDYWRCTNEIRNVDEVTGLVFDARIGRREIQGVDFLRFDDEGLIVELTVMIRPLSGLLALAADIGPKIDAAGADAHASPPPYGGP